MADEMNTERDMPEGITRDDTAHGETYYTAADMATASDQGFRDGVASLGAAEPANGLVTVPEVPTNAMTSAGANAVEDPEHERSSWDLAENVWRAMVEAAPALTQVAAIAAGSPVVKESLTTDSAAGAVYAELQQKHNDYVETVGLMLDAIGYKEEYALQWPKEKASITFKRWFDEQLASHGQALRLLTQKEKDSLGRRAEGMDGNEWDQWVQEKFAQVNGLRVQGGSYEWDRA